MWQPISEPAFPSERHPPSERTVAVRQTYVLRDSSTSEFGVCDLRVAILNGPLSGIYGGVGERCVSASLRRQPGINDPQERAERGASVA